MTTRFIRQSLSIPANTQCTFTEHVFSAKGPEGQLSLEVSPELAVTVSPTHISVTPAAHVATPFPKEVSAQCGTIWHLIQNMLIGVSRRFEKNLELIGVGYRAELKEEILNLHIGYSHIVTYPVPVDIKITVEKNIVKVSGIDKQRVGQIAAEIRKFRSPEPYKGKGIKYVDEVIRRKEGKGAK